MKKVDVIIAGLGISGATVALEMKKRGKSVVAFDTTNENRSSRLAAGLFNPVTGKMMTKAWLADLLFPSLHAFYRDAENTFGTRFLHSIPICIPFLSNAEQNDWMSKSADGSLQEYIQEVYTVSRYGNLIHDDLGGVLLKASGYVDTNTYLDTVAKWLASEGNFRPARLEPERLIIENDLIRYDDIEATHVIFCDGFHSTRNSFLSWLPILPLKGETFEIAFPGEANCIFNRGAYVLPVGGGRYKVGSTYERHGQEGISEKGKQELIEKLAGLIRPSYQVLHHDWGIRPTTYDRRPVLGPHPKYPNVLIFNGMGTKAISQSPYFSSVLADYFLSDGQIKKEVNISRFYPLYSKSRD